MPTIQQVSDTPDIQVIRSQSPGETLDGGPGIDIYKGISGGQDVFVLGGDETLPLLQDILPDVPLTGVIADSRVPGSIIIDFNVGEDTIQFTDGLTTAQRLFVDFELPIQPFYNLFVPEGTPLQEAINTAVRSLDTSAEDLDPNNDGALEGAAIINPADSTITDIVLNITPNELVAALEPGNRPEENPFILPTVTINSLNPNITEGGTPGQILFSINSPQNNDIAINYIIGGTATNGIDYQAITLPFVTIPAGQTSSEPININAIADGIPEPVETVNLSLQPSGNNNYIVGGVNTATININDTSAVREINFDDAQNLQGFIDIDPLTGVTFNNALGIVSFAQGGSGNFTDSLVDPGQGRAITYAEGGSIIMNVPDGFSGQLSFRYASPFFNHQVVVYDSPNATGNILANVILDRTPDSLTTPGAYVLTVQEQQINFNGFAQSVSFGSAPDKLIIDDIKLFS